VCILPSLAPVRDVVSLREREREREARRGTDATGNGNTTGEDPTHRTPPTGDLYREKDPAGDPPLEGRATQGTRTEHTQTVPSMGTAGATASTTKENSRASRGSGGGGFTFTGARYTWGGATHGEEERGDMYQTSFAPT